MAGGQKSLAIPGLNNQECRYVVYCFFIYVPNLIGTEKKASITFLRLCRASCNGSAQFNSNLDVESLDHKEEPVLEGQLILKHVWVQKWSVSREKIPSRGGHYRRFFGWHEFHFADDGAQGNFHLFHGKSHADAVAWAQSEGGICVRVDLVFVFWRPPVGMKPFLLSRVLTSIHADNRELRFGFSAVRHNFIKHKLIMSRSRSMIKFDIGKISRSVTLQKVTVDTTRTWTNRQSHNSTVLNLVIAKWIVDDPQEIQELWMKNDPAMYSWTQVAHNWPTLLWWP